MHKENEPKREKRVRAECILSQKSGPALAGPARPATTALFVIKIFVFLFLRGHSAQVLLYREGSEQPVHLICLFVCFVA